MDWGHAMQVAAEKHLDAVNEAFSAYEEGRTPEVEDPSWGPYCGCETCVVREVLAGAWPVIEAMIEHEVKAALTTKGLNQLLDDVENGGS